MDQTRPVALVVSVLPVSDHVQQLQRLPAIRKDLRDDLGLLQRTLNCLRFPDRPQAPVFELPQAWYHGAEVVSYP